MHRRTRNRRSDFHHKTARTLVNECDVIALEDLRVVNMTRSASGTLEQPGTNVAAKRRRCTRPQQDTAVCPVHGGMDADVNGALNIYARAGLGSRRADAA